MRKGPANTQRGAQRFVNELIARVRRAGAVGEVPVRADSGFWSRSRRESYTERVDRIDETSRDECSQWHSQSSTTPSST
jgi:hypothetical protein